MRRGLRSLAGCGAASVALQVARALAGGSAGLALVLAQLFLPRIAASRISSRVGSYGKVSSVSVSALPAMELLWGDADSVARDAPGA